MAVDHLRFLSPIFAWAFWPGRLAFPLFGMIAAENFLRSSDKERYLRRLLPWAFMAEVPYVLLTYSCGNILWLFVFGFAAVKYRNVVLAVAATLGSYGALGMAAVGCWMFSARWGVLGGVVANPFPANVISAAACVLPLRRVEIRPAPVFVRGALLPFYVGHLALYVVIRELVFR